MLLGIFSQITPILGASECIRVGSLDPSLTGAFGYLSNVPITGLDNTDATKVASFLIQPVNVPSVTTVALISNSSVPNDATPFITDISYAMPGYSKSTPASLNVNWLYRVSRDIDSACMYQSATGSNHGSVDVSFHTKKTCVQLPVQEAPGESSIPSELSVLDNLIVLLGQEVSGPPADLDDNYYNTFWLERNATGGYMGCFREGVLFYKHHTGKLNFYVTDGSEQTVEDVNGDELKMETGKVYFNLTGNGENKFCQVIDYQKVYETAPLVYTTPELEAGSDGEISAWVESTCLTDFKVCVKRTGQEFDGSSDNVTVHYGAVGNHSNCEGVSADPHKECVNGVNQCITNCTAHQSRSCKDVTGPVCANDFGTYDNECELSKYVCANYDESFHATINVAYEGNCTEKGYDIGMVELESVAADPLTRFCSDIAIDSSKTHAFADVQVIVTPNWNISSPGEDNTIHGATGAWVESVNSTHFTACCKTSYSSDHHGEKCNVNYLVYQKNLEYQTGGEMVAGEPVVLPDFATSSGCANISDFDDGSSINDKHIVFSPTVPAPADGGLATWIEILENSGSFFHRFCAIQMRQFSGKRENVTMHYIMTGQQSSVQQHPYEQQFDGQAAEGTSCSLVDGFSNTIPDNGLVFQSVSKNVTGESSVSFENEYSSNTMIVWSEGTNSTVAQICIEDLMDDAQHPGDLHLNVFYVPNP